MKTIGADFDVIIVGSGPSGVHSALTFIRAGLKVGMVDLGGVETKYHESIPAKSFSEIRRTDEQQARYFLGENLEGIPRPGELIGPQLTPPRKYLMREADQHFPLVSDTFFPLQSTAMGGLTAGWGANAYALESHELKKIGLPPENIRPLYSEVANDIGVSANAKDDIASHVVGYTGTQEPLEVDTVSELLLDKFQLTRREFHRKHFHLGKTPLAILSQKLGDREPNPLRDMDYWTDGPEQSIYRASITLNALKHEKHFTYLSNRLALRFIDDVDQKKIRVVLQDVRERKEEVIRAKALVLCAGPLQSAKIILSSFQDSQVRLPIMANPNAHLVGILWKQLGLPAKDKRYSLAQLTALQRQSDKEWMCGQLHSYRSLLLFRLANEIALPPFLSVPFLRLTLSSLVFTNLLFPETADKSRRWLRQGNVNGREVLEVHYERSFAERQITKKELRKFRYSLIKLGVIPLTHRFAVHGASMHYGGSIPISENAAPYTCDGMGKLRGANHVFVSDSSLWNYLPAKGLTFTLMAQARWIAQSIVKEYF